MHQNGLKGEYILHRDRIDKLLETAAQSPFAVVSAAAGFGKTQAVSAYLERSEYRNVWMSITALDNIPSRFWEHFTASCKRHRPDLAARMEVLGFPDSLQAFDAFLAEITEELYRDSRFVIFVFDNIHLITEPLIQKFFTSLIEARTVNNSVFFLTRHWPVYGWEIRETPQLVVTDELRFTAEEIFELFENIHMDWDMEEAVKIRQYVSGWPMALSIAAHYLQRHDTEYAEKLKFSSTKPVLFQLFEEEIFTQYTEKEQAVLIKLSVLESFPRGLVFAVSGEKHRDLHQLLAANLFIKYDAQTERFYFHPLYHDYLKEKLLSIDPEEVEEAYQKAAEWCRQEGHYYDAINYYRCCGDSASIWETLELFVAKRHPKSEADFLINEIETLPEELKEKQPMTRIVLAALLVNNLRFLESLQVITDVQSELEAKPVNPDNQALLGECYVARGLISLGMGSLDFASYFKLASTLLPQGSRYWGKEIRLIEFGPGLNLQKPGASELESGIASYTEGVPFITDVLHGAGYGLDSLCRSEALFLSGDVKGAFEPAYQALYAAKSKDQYDIIGNALFILLRCYTALGDYQNIKDTFAHVNQYEKEKASASLGIWDIVKGWYYTEVEDTKRVPGWIRNAVHSSYSPLSIERPVLVQLRCLIVEGKMEEALALSEQLEYLAKSKQSVIAMIYVELGRCFAHYASGHMEAAIRSLTAAYQLTGDNSIVMPFVEYGSPMRSLLERVRSMAADEIAPEWVERIHAKASTYAKRRAYLVNCYRQEQESLPGDFGLSRRELELLTHLSQGLTREEISECMNLTLNTVKSMLKQIFAKLGAVNSVDAVRIAMIYKLI